MTHTWKIARRFLAIRRPLVMGILNVTPDSFSDGGMFADRASAFYRAEQMIREGADIIDIGGESTRPGSSPVEPSVEIDRTAALIEEIVKQFDVPISIDTSKSSVAAAALEAGAEIINDISGLRWDIGVADVAARSGAGLILMHSRGPFEAMHSQAPVEDIISDVKADLRRSTSQAIEAGVQNENIVIDVGIGFGKTPEQNLELLSRLGAIADAFAEFPLLVGTSRKSFIAKAVGSNIGPDERLAGSLASAAIAVWNGASIVRVHDVEETVQALAVVNAIKQYSSAICGPSDRPFHG